MSKIIRKEYQIAVKETVVKYYTVVAESGKDALERFDDCELDYDTQDWVHDTKPKIESMTEILECPLKGEGWTETKVDASKIGKFEWHYTDECEGEMREGRTHCYVCDEGIRNSKKRLLEEKEKEYLNKTYSGNEFKVVEN